MKRVFFLAFGIIAYCVFLGTFIYAIGFIGNQEVANSIDASPKHSLSYRILVNVSLLAFCAIEYTFMTRSVIRNWWNRIVPKQAEQSAMILIACPSILFIMWNWEPIGGVVWIITNENVRTLLLFIYLFGWSTLFMSSFLLDHFKLFGLKQSWFYFKSKPYKSASFPSAFFYRFVRQPLYLGILLALWITPTMTIAHLVLATIVTAYLLFSLQLESKSIYVNYGQEYVN